MKVWLVEPYYTGSHRAWADGFQGHSRHDVRLLTLPGRFWKWRMQGGAVTLARLALELEGQPDAILATDMVNLPVFLSLAGEPLASTPVVLYFHENQLTYPLQPGEKRDLHYGFVNFVSALRADAVWFNSDYHLEAFTEELPRLLRHFPDYNELWAVEAVRARARVLPLGLDLKRFDVHRPAVGESRRARILWNHRWEYDKDPSTFFRALYALADEGADFEVVLLGESFRNQPDEFMEARQRLSDRIAHFGYAEDASTYGRLLWSADIVVSTALHEFFGASVVEACYCHCFPVLPRRLSYPELIPGSYHDLCLYEDFEGLLSRLRCAISGVSETGLDEIRDHVARFDWGEAVPRYDGILGEVVATGQRKRWLI